MHLDFGNLSKSALVSSWEMEMPTSCAPSLLAGFLYSLPHSSGNDRKQRLGQYKQESIFPFYHSRLLLHRQHPCLCKLSAGQEN